jgi:hypothetical protein
MESFTATLRFQNERLTSRDTYLMVLVFVVSCDLSSDDGTTVTKC